MIRRGLYILLMLGFLSMGAAPCFSQLDIQTVTVENFHPLVDGEYTYSGSELSYSDWAGNPRYERDLYSYGSDSDFRIVKVINNGTIIFFLQAINLSEFSPLVTFTPDGNVTYDTSFFQDTGNWSIYIDGVLWSSKPLDPYEQAFPDWESAAVKIPLGFGFAMAFWAVAVALSISMRWVRDLASVAT